MYNFFLNCANILEEKELKRMNLGFLITRDSIPNIVRAR